MYMILKKIIYILIFSNICVRFIYLFITRFGTTGATNMDVPTAGPEQTLPNEDLVAYDLNSIVKLRMGESDFSSIPPKSVPGILEKAAKEVPNKPALAFKKNPKDTEFQFITFREYHHLSRIVAKAFLKLGLERLHSVAIMGFNSPQWFLSYFGCINAGGIACGIYSTNSAEATLYCLEKGKTDIAVVEDDSQVQKIMKFKHELMPKLKAVIQYSGTPIAEGVLSWEELLKIGEEQDDTALDEALKRIVINQCCTLIFTSGTSGNPKGVMLSHDNLIWTASSALDKSLAVLSDEKMISYLPLSHVAALIVDIYFHITYKITIYFASKDALKEGLIKTLVEVRPTRFFGVPRVYEKIFEKIKVRDSDSGFFRRLLLDWAKGRGLQRTFELMNGINKLNFGYVIARFFLFSKIKYELGFDLCKTFWSGGAPLSNDIKLYLASWDILIFEAYGMSESTGPHTINRSLDFRLDSSGKTIFGCQTKIENANEEKEGEICMFGRNIFMGYVNDPEQTNEVIDKDGWLHSGDIGKVDDNFIYITGRIKELLITAGGENIAPVLIEQNVKAELPFVGHAVLICEQKKFLSMLLTLSSEVNASTGEPLDKLAPAVIKWLNDLNLPYTKASEVMESGPRQEAGYNTTSTCLVFTKRLANLEINDIFRGCVVVPESVTQLHLYKMNHTGCSQIILDAIQKGIDAANLKAISNAQKIQKFAILPRDFSITTGELGPTFKLRRKVISQKYKDVIDKFYNG